MLSDSFEDLVGDDQVADLVRMHAIGMDEPVRGSLACPYVCEQAIIFLCKLTDGIVVTLCLLHTP